ncbi:MAG: hypothetical protein H6657_09310 [Ardenticatenaceae bacterium]|nr:hypothetical protein [Ardenticatenaceae bacterium]
MSYDQKRKRFLKSLEKEKLESDVVDESFKARRSREQLGYIDELAQTKKKLSSTILMLNPYSEYYQIIDKYVSYDLPLGIIKLMLALIVIVMIPFLCIGGSESLLFFMILPFIFIFYFGIVAFGYSRKGEAVKNIEKEISTIRQNIAENQ